MITPFCSRLDDEYFKDVRTHLKADEVWFAICKIGGIRNPQKKEEAYLLCVEDVLYKRNSIDWAKEIVKEWLRTEEAQKKVSVLFNAYRVEQAKKRFIQCTYQQQIQRKEDPKSNKIAYLGIGRSLTVDDYDKPVVRLAPSSQTDDWTYVQREKSCQPLVLKKMSWGAYTFEQDASKIYLSYSEYGDRNWLQLDEYIAFLETLLSR